MSSSTRVHLRSLFLTQKEFLCNISNFSEVILNCWKTWGENENVSHSHQISTMSKKRSTLCTTFWNKYSTFLNYKESILSYDLR